MKILTYKGMIAIISIIMYCGPDSNYWAPVWAMRLYMWTIYYVEVWSCQVVSLFFT